MRRPIPSGSVANRARSLTKVGPPKRALPEVPRRDLEWRFHFLLGAMVYTMADTGRIQALTDGACDPGRAEDALQRMIPFFAAGFRSAPGPAIARRRRGRTNDRVEASRT